jgi:hypothetical protein
MWYQVLTARYGEEAGRLEVGGRSGSVWWREVSRIQDGVSDVGGGWFGRRIGNRVNSFFWTGLWLSSLENECI